MNQNQEPWSSEKRIRKPYRPPKIWATESKRATGETLYKSNKKTNMYGTVFKKSSYSAVVKDVQLSVMAPDAKRSEKTPVDIKVLKDVEVQTMVLKVRRTTMTDVDIEERKISYNDLRNQSKTHFVERHMFKSNTEAYQFQYKLCHHFGDCMATMNNDIAYVVKFDEEEFNQHYSPHLENAAKTRINQLFESNFFLNHYGGKCNVHSIILCAQELLILDFYSEDGEVKLLCRKYQQADIQKNVDDGRAIHLTRSL